MPTPMTVSASASAVASSRSVGVAPGRGPQTKSVPSTIQAAMNGAARASMRCSEL